jgi:hypothetical protein
MIAWTGAALAADRTVEVPFRPPAEIPLFVKAELREERGTAKGDDCPGAVRLAIEQAAAHGTVVRVTVAEDDLAEAAQVACKQRKAGDAISASVVDLTVLVMEPGAPASVYPPMTVERAVQIAATIGAVSGGGLRAATIDDLGGQAWVRLGEVAFEAPLNQTQLDENDRAVKAYEAFVPEWVTRWGAALSTVPEVTGAVLEVTVPSEDPSVGKKSRTNEIFRFAVPTVGTVAFLHGDQGDDQFLAGCRIERAADARKRVFAPFALDVGAGGLAREGAHATIDRAGLDVKEEDLEGVQDQ